RTLNNIAEKLGDTKQNVAKLLDKNPQLDGMMKECQDSLGITKARQIDNEFDSFEFSPPDYKYAVATQNVHRVIFPHNGMPVMAMINQEKIFKYRIVGFSYGKGYFPTLLLTPELFTTIGEIAPHSFYKRTAALSFVIKTSEDEVIQLREGSRVSYLSHLNKNEPIQLAKLKEGMKVSLYDVRQKLFDINAVSNQYGAQPNNSFARTLEKCFFGKNILVRTFWQYPQAREANSNEPTAHSADVVCQAETESDYQNLLLFFKPIASHTYSFPVTKEVISKSVNADPEEFAKFIKAKLIAGL
ncbi:MAG: hypothetical protein M3R00_02670, partial [Pseudomonadota bacterium]|nr:hypothetical protein [Pseudomonadota bacterium]